MADAVEPQSAVLSVDRCASNIVRSSPSGAVSSPSGSVPTSAGAVACVIACAVVGGGMGAVVGGRLGAVVGGGLGGTSVDHASRCKGACLAPRVSK